EEHDFDRQLRRDPLVISVTGDEHAFPDARRRRDPEVVVAYRDTASRRRGSETRPLPDVAVPHGDPAEAPQSRLGFGEPRVPPTRAEIAVTSLGDRHDAHRPWRLLDPAEDVHSPAFVSNRPFLPAKEVADEARVTDQIHQVPV